MESRSTGGVRGPITERGRPEEVLEATQTMVKGCPARERGRASPGCHGQRGEGWCERQHEPRRQAAAARLCGGPRPSATLAARCRRILRITAGSVMNATNHIVALHRGHTRGSASQTRWMSSAQRRHRTAARGRSALRRCVAPANECQVRNERNCVLTPRQLSHMPARHPFPMPVKKVRW